MRRLLVVVGVVSAVGGVVLVVRPELATFGQQSLLTILGVLALLQAGRVALDRRSATRDAVGTPDPETEQDLPAPGDDLETSLAAVRRRAPTLSRQAELQRRQRRETVRERIEAAAVETIVRQHGCTRERARQALSTGEWTEDPDAAAFFTGELEGVGRRGRLRRALGSEPPYSRRARHAARAVAALADAERVEPLSPMGPGPDEETTSAASETGETATDGGHREAR